jgi:hypothetical protein
VSRRVAVAARDREAIHRGAAVRGVIFARHYFGGEHAPERGVQRHALRSHRHDLGAREVRDDRLRGCEQAVSVEAVEARSVRECRG